MLALEQNEKMFANAFVACSIILLNFWCLLAVLFELLCRINARLYEFLTRLCTVLISLSIAKFSKLYLCEQLHLYITSNQREEIIFPLFSF